MADRAASCWLGDHNDLVSAQLAARLFPALMRRPPGNGVSGRIRAVATRINKRMPIEIRSYRPSDRPSIRSICCDTADAGRPLEALLGEPRPFPALRELFADLLASAYTDHTWRLVWVAVHGKEVVGYVTGCLDEARLHRILVLHVLPLAIGSALVRGALFRRSVLALLWANRGHPFRHARRSKGYSAHLHLNISQDARGQGAGSALLQRFIEAAREARVRGVTATVREDNADGRAFFERNGFVPLVRHRLFRLPSGTVRYAIIHGRQI